MIRSMFAAVAGLRTHQNRMDVISNNIANVNTYGFKAGRATFKESIYQNLYNSASGNNVLGGKNPSQVGYGSQIGSISVNHAPGNYEPTGYATDCMIGGNGYFLVGPKIGAVQQGIANSGTDIPKLNLTRVGAFTVDGDGYLVDENRNVVYGMQLDNPGYVPGTGNLDDIMKQDVLVPIRVPIDQATKLPINLEDIAIGDDGVITGTMDDGTIIKFGQLAICNVPNPNALEKIGSSYYAIRNNTGEVHAFKPGEGTTGSLVSNGLEMSTTDMATEISNMIITQRGFQANSKMITVSDEMLQDLISMKR